MRRYGTPALLLALAAAMLLSVTALQALAQTPCNLNDGRLNARPHRDCGAPVAIYRQGNTIVVLGVDNNPGPDEVAATAPADSEIPANANTIIGQGTNPVTGRPVIISRLTTGEYQLNTFSADGSAYIVVWYRGREDLYHLDPVTGQPLDGAQPIVASDAPNPGAGSRNAPPVPRATTSGGGSSGTSSTTAPVIISENAPDAVPLSNCQVTTTRIVRLRTAPDTDSDVITRLPYRTSWRATERTANWFRVVYQNTQGWVNADFLSATGGCDLPG